MNELQNIPYPYHWQNYSDDAARNIETYNKYIGKSRAESFDPKKTSDIVTKASIVSKKILSLVEVLEAKEKKWRLVKPIRYLLEHLPTIQTLRAAKNWLGISKAFEDEKWDTAIELLHKINRSKEKEKVINFPYSSWEECRDKSGINPRVNLVDMSSATKKASWVEKKSYDDYLFPIYLSLISTAYLNRALKSDLESNGTLSEEAKKDLYRAKVYAQVWARGLQEYTYRAIILRENGCPVKKIENLAQNLIGRK